MPKTAKEEVANCELSAIHRRFSVTEDDLSEVLAGGEVDNDFQCPIGRFVPLARRKGIIMCLTGRCSNLDATVHE